MPRFMYVVERSRADLEERLSTDFAGQADIAVVRDRRHSERRLEAQGIPAERRRSDRRRQMELDDELRTEGFFLTASSDLVLIIVS